MILSTALKRDNFKVIKGQSQNFWEVFRKSLKDVKSSARQIREYLNLRQKIIKKSYNNYPLGAKLKSI